MNRVVNFERFEEFVDFNEDFINSNPMLYYFLSETINRVFNGKVPVFKFFNVVDDERCYLIALMVEDVCLLYGNQCGDKMILKLSEELEFYKFKRYNFAGTKSVIDALFDLHKAIYELHKHRIILYFP